MNPHLRLFTLNLVALVSVALFGQTEVPRPLYTGSISDLVPSGNETYRNGSLTFLTDHRLAVGICSNQGCSLEIIEIDGEHARLLARRNELDNFSDLFRAPDGGVILGPRTLLLDSKLDTSQSIPKTWIGHSDISVTGKTFVGVTREGWKIFDMGSPTAPIRSGSGRVVSVSDQAIAYIQQGNMRIEAIDGTLLGSFAVKDYAPTVRILGKDRIWFDDGRKPQVRDFNGKTLISVDRLDGWGVRTGRSADGSRLIVDRFTRHIPFLQNAKEVAIAFLTLGMGVGDESDNGEMIRVIDTQTGKRCFDWRATGDLLHGGDSHGDIDPSGQTVAIMTRTSLYIYALPATCAN